MSPTQRCKAKKMSLNQHSTNCHSRNRRVTMLGVTQAICLYWSFFYSGPNPCPTHPAFQGLFRIWGINWPVLGAIILPRRNSNLKTNNFHLKTKRNGLVLKTVQATMTGGQVEATRPRLAAMEKEEPTEEATLLHWQSQGSVFVLMHRKWTDPSLLRLRYMSFIFP